MDRKHETVEFQIWEKGKKLKQYLSALKHILKNGKDREDRTGVGTRGVFGYQMRFNLKDGFPAVTTKKLAWRSVVSELIWFLEGETDEEGWQKYILEKTEKNYTKKRQFGQPTQTNKEKP